MSDSVECAFGLATQEDEIVDLEGRFGLLVSTPVNFAVTMHTSVLGDRQVPHSYRHHLLEYLPPFSDKVV